MSWQKSDAYKFTDCIRRFKFVDAESYGILWNIGVWSVLKGEFIDILCEMLKFIACGVKKKCVSSVCQANLRRSFSILNEWGLKNRSFRPDMIFV